ncbi:unnamed protein product, partial [Closterium sp. NIES-53]
MYLMTCTRPDLAYPLSLLSSYVAPDASWVDELAPAARAPPASGPSTAPTARTLLATGPTAAPAARAPPAQGTLAAPSDRRVAACFL